MSLYSRATETVRSEGLYRTLLLFFRFISYKINYHRRISNYPTYVSRLFFRLTKLWVRGTIYFGRFLFECKFTDANPYKNIWVNPNEIQMETSTAARRRGWVEHGDWDQMTKPFLSRPIPNGICQRYANGRSWNNIPITSECEQKDIIQLYESIQSEGYVSQRELLRQSQDTAWTNLNDSMHPLVNEVGVDIGRNGNFLWNMCGQHRLAIAKVLEIDQIPVQVFRRHTEWQEIRNKIRKGENIPERYLEHPDLEDIS